MEQLARTPEPNTSQQILSLKYNISQLARQLESEKSKTKLEDDRRFWMMENKHLSRLLNERDSTIKSLKKLSRQNSPYHATKEKKPGDASLQVASYKSKIAQLEKEMKRLNKVVGSLTQLCEVLQSTVKSQNKQIEILESQNNKMRGAAKIKAKQAKSKYEYMDSEIRNRMSGSVREMAESGSDLKNSFGLDIVRTSENNDYVEEDSELREEIEMELGNYSQVKNTREEEQNNRRVLCMMMKEIKDLKETIRAMKDNGKEDSEFLQTSTKEETNKKGSSVSFQEMLRFQQKNKSTSRIAELKKKITDPEEKVKRKSPISARLRNFD